MSDVTGCWKTQVSDYTSSTVYAYFRCGLIAKPLILHTFYVLISMMSIVAIKLSFRAQNGKFFAGK